MLQIKDTLVSLDLIERFFCCDLNVCKGECCIDGDAGAPLTAEEALAIEDVLPYVRPMLSPRALEVIDAQGVCYVDPEGELVTSIVDGRDCVFTTYAPGGICLCALEKAWREGLAPQTKPASCHLYPARLRPCGLMTAVNMHNWKICRSAEKNGRHRNIRAYEFLKEPLVRRFGQEWYDELALTAAEYLKQNQNL